MRGSMADWFAVTAAPAPMFRQKSSSVVLCGMAPSSDWSESCKFPDRSYTAYDPLIIAQ